MTVHVHKDNGTVGYGDHFHEPPAEIEGRTWTFDCTPECEARILRDVEHTGRTVASVPLTEDEKAEEELLEASSRKDVTKLAAALGQLANAGAKGE
jgi:hypothetical protein